MGRPGTAERLRLPPSSPPDALRRLPFRWTVCGRAIPGTDRDAGASSSLHKRWADHPPAEGGGWGGRGLVAAGAGGTLEGISGRGKAVRAVLRRAGERPPGDIQAGDAGGGGGF